MFLRYSKRLSTLEIQCVVASTFRAINFSHNTFDNNFLLKEATNDFHFNSDHGLGKINARLKQAGNHY